MRYNNTDLHTSDAKWLLATTPVVQISCPSTSATLRREHKTPTLHNTRTTFAYYAPLVATT